MEIITLPVGSLQANCYLVFDTESRDTVIIDPGDEATFITDEILRLKLKPLAILTTHGHFDHILSAWELQMAFNIPFYLHPKDKFLLDRMQDSASHWLGHQVVEKPPVSTRTLLVDLQGESLKLIETPGHTPGSVCYYFPQEKVIFTGDTLFSEGVGSTEHSYSSKSDLYKSIKEVKIKFKNWQAYPGHGESFIL